VYHCSSRQCFGTPSLRAGSAAVYLARLVKSTRPSKNLHDLTTILGDCEPKQNTSAETNGESESTFPKIEAFTAAHRPPNQHKKTLVYRISNYAQLVYLNVTRVTLPVKHSPNPTTNHNKLGTRISQLSKLHLRPNIHTPNGFGPFHPTPIDMSHRDLHPLIQRSVRSD
jgi:hypothetical protein